MSVSISGRVNENEVKLNHNITTVDKNLKQKTVVTIINKPISDLKNSSFSLQPKIE